MVAWRSPIKCSVKHVNNGIRFMNTYLSLNPNPNGAMSVFYIVIFSVVDSPPYRCVSHHEYTPSEPSEISCCPFTREAKPFSDRFCIVTFAKMERFPLSAL